MQAGQRVVSTEDGTEGEILTVVVHEIYSYFVRFDDGTEDWFDSVQLDPLTEVEGAAV